jgi:hypothetical protein
VFDCDLSDGIDDNVLAEEPVAYRPIQNILKNWRDKVADHIYDTESAVVGKVVLEGMMDLHLGVDNVINTEENRDAAWRAGELGLVKGLAISDRFST